MVIRYKLAEKMSEKLDEMGKDLGEMIAEINNASSTLNKNSKADDPVSFYYHHLKKPRNALANSELFFFLKKKVIPSRQNPQQPSDPITRDRPRYCSATSESRCRTAEQPDLETVCRLQWAHQRGGGGLLSLLSWKEVMMMNHDTCVYN